MEILLAIIALIVISGFFSGSETGLTGASRAKIHNLKLDGNKRAAQVSHLRQEEDKLIGAILLGNNTVNIAASVLATSFAYTHMEEGGEIVVTVVMTLVVLIFAEVLPKTYAIQNAERVALKVAPIFMILVKLLAPVTIMVRWIVNGMLTFFRLNKQEDIEGADMLRGAIELHHEEGKVVKSDRDMLGSILDLAETEVYDVMLHRKEVITINVDMPVKEALQKIMDGRFTRIPVWKDDADNIVGVLHSKDLVRAVYQAETEGKEIPAIVDVMSEPWFVPVTTSLKNQLHAFREKHQHFALVVDEYGALMGIVTLEDILEEIVGQIEDEYDTHHQHLKPQLDGSYVIDGRMTIRDLNRDLDWSLPDEEAATVAGLVIHEAQLIPEIQQVFHFHGCRFEILKKKRNQLSSIRITRLDNISGGEGD